MPYRFFFSYASEAHRASSWNNWGDSGNHLEEFFQALCNRVALITGEEIASVGYRDRDRLTLASFWSKNLVTALQSSRVLVSIVSSHYLDSENCDREVEFFRRRFNLLGGRDSHRIIPIFWEDYMTCKMHMADEVERFFLDLQLRQAGMPASYPHTGVYRLYTLGEQAARNALIDVVAKAILSLSELPALPELPGAGEFKELPSFFAGREQRVKPSLAVGPKGTNVVYAVGTRGEAVKHGFANAGGYDAARERWTPFGRSPGETIELITRHGLNTAGQDDSDYRNLGLAPDLNDRLRAAKAVNSPVVIVLDRCSLRVPAIEAALRDYDDRDYPNVGLIAASGSELDEPLLAQTLPTKYGHRRPNHSWAVPDDRDFYVLKVEEVISGLRRGLQQAGPTAISPPAAPLPGI
jgi:hypothetical protein